MARPRKLTKGQTPTVDSVENDRLDPAAEGEKQANIVSDTDGKIVASLESYRLEAEQARQSGPNDRDSKWRENLDLYWNRHDFSLKKSWQAKETMPEVPSYVDRFAAALKDALIAQPSGFYTVLDPTDEEGTLAEAVKRATDVWLSRAGRNQMGTLLPFSAVFEEQMKLGAIMACCTVTTWKEDVPGGRVSIETQDPRMIWLDPTFRNLYRLRRIEMDKHSVTDLAQARDDAGNPLFNLPAVEALIQGLAPSEQAEQENLAGHGKGVSSGRTPIVLDEYIATVVDERGQRIADRGLMVVANQKHLIRGPEANPFWHGDDWVLYAPLVPVPLSAYGRSYMEDFGAISRTFTELTNLLLDAVHVSSLKAWAVVPDMLMNPGQLAEGITPNKVFQLEQGFDARQFMAPIEMGSLPPESVRMWESLKGELTEAAKMNEIGIGQFAPKGRTSATEINETQASSSALIRSVAQTVETRFLDPQLDKTWKTGFQHVSEDDVAIQNAMGKDMFQALIAKRRELVSRPFTFQARGISELLKRGALLRSLLGIIQFVSSNPIFFQEFTRVVSMQRLISFLFTLSGIDLKILAATEQERLTAQIAGPLSAAGMTPGGTPGEQPNPATAGGQMAQLNSMFGG